MVSALRSIPNPAAAAIAYGVKNKGSSLDITTPPSGHLHRYFKQLRRFLTFEECSIFIYLPEQKEKGLCCGALFIVLSPLYLPLEPFVCDLKYHVLCNLLMHKPPQEFIGIIELGL